MRAVAICVYWIRAIAQAGRICAGTIQNTEQLVRLCGAVAAACVVGEGGMGGIKTGVEHGDDDVLRPWCRSCLAARRCHPKSHWRQ